MNHTPSRSTWADAAGAADLRPDDVMAVIVGEHELAIYSVEGEVFATDASCTHGTASLCDGFLIGHEIECPLHQGRFDVRTGQPTCEPATHAIRCWPVKVEAGRVWVQIQAPAQG